MEGVWGNLVAIRVPNREKLFDVEGVGHALYQIYYCALDPLSTLTHMDLSLPSTYRYLGSPPSTLPMSVAPEPETSSMGILLGYKMLLQVIALILAFATCKVKVKGLDDAKYIAAATYVTSIVWAVLIVSTYTLKGVVNVYPCLFSTGYFVGTTFILGLIFLPKVGEGGDIM